MAFYILEILSYISFSKYSQVVQTDIIILTQKLKPLSEASVNEMMFTPLVKPHWRSFASCQSASFHCTEQLPGRLINCQSLGEVVYRVWREICFISQGLLMGYSEHSQYLLNNGVCEGGGSVLRE